MNTYMNHRLSFIIIIEKRCLLGTSEKGLGKTKYKNTVHFKVKRIMEGTLHAFKTDREKIVV